MLLDGGPSRAFSNSDVPIMEEDLNMLKVSILRRYIFLVCLLFYIYIYIFYNPASEKGEKVVYSIDYSSKCAELFQVHHCVSSSTVITVRLK